MSQQYSTFIIDNDSCCIKEETESFPSTHSTVLGSINEEIDMHQNNDGNNQSYHTKE